MSNHSTRFLEQNVRIITFVSNLNNKRVVKLISGILELLALFLES